MIRRALTGLALIAAMGCSTPVYKRPEGGEAIKQPDVCEKTTLVVQTHTYGWQLNCYDKEGGLRYFAWDRDNGGWLEKVITK